MITDEAKTLIESNYKNIWGFAMREMKHQKKTNLPDISKTNAWNVTAIQYHLAGATGRELQEFVMKLIQANGCKSRKKKVKSQIPRKSRLESLQQKRAEIEAKIRKEESKLYCGTFFRVVAENGDKFTTVFIPNKRRIFSSSAKQASSLAKKLDEIWALKDAG